MAGISIFREKDSGIYDAMNKALADIDTQWVYFLGADDRLLPGFMDLISQLSSLNNIYYGNVLYSSDRKQYDGKFNTVKLVYRNICHQSIFYPLDVLRKNPFSTRYPIRADWASNIDLMSRFEFVYCDYTVAIYNNEEGISTTNKDVVFDSEKNALFRETFGAGYYLLSFTAPLLARIYKMFTPPRRKPGP